MKIEIENPHSDNKSLELFRFERAVFMALAEKIIEVLDGDHELSPVEIEFWVKRAIYFNEFASADSELIQKFIYVLESQAKERNAHLN